MPEGIELPEAPEEHDDNPFLVPVSVTISILAVFVAGITFLGHRAIPKSCCYSRKLPTNGLTTRPKIFAYTKCKVSWTCSGRWPLRIRKRAAAGEIQ